MIRSVGSLGPRKLRGKVCLLRVDLNVEPGGEEHSNRFDAIVPTAKFLGRGGAKVVMMSHRGRPEGMDPAWSLKPLVPLLSAKIGRPVAFLPHFSFPWLRKQIRESKSRCILLENLRFLPGEETNDQKLARELASLGDLYVNEAFAVSHRRHASVVGITKLLPSYAGLNLIEEVRVLEAVAVHPKHPFTVIVGGAKISDKIGIIEHLLPKANHVLLGSGIAATFFLAQGLPVGQSPVERNMLPLVRRLLASPKVVCPPDVRMERQRILDIGPRASALYAEYIAKSRTIVWNGPVGLFEEAKFARGTCELWRAILRRRGAQIVVGGGETVTSLSLLKANSYKLKANIFLSTGGGAMLEYLSGKKLPGIEVLTK